MIAETAGETCGSNDGVYVCAERDVTMQTHDVHRCKIMGQEIMQKSC